MGRTSTCSVHMCACRTGPGGRTPKAKRPVPDLRTPPFIFCPPPPPPDPL